VPSLRTLPSSLLRGVRRAALRAGLKLVAVAHENILAVDLDYLLRRIASTRSHSLTVNTEKLPNLEFAAEWDDPESAFREPQVLFEVEHPVQLRHRLREILIDHSFVMPCEEDLLASSRQRRFQWLQDFVFEAV
jgi:hypothetical protein